MSEPALEKLLETCGTSGGFDLTIMNEETRKQWRKHVRLPFAVIGRSPQADLGLFDPTVSWRHAYLQVVEGRVLCIDLESRTGVHWGGRVEEAGWLDAEQDVRIGPFSLRVADVAGGIAGAGNDSSRFLTRLANEASLPRVTLEFKKAVLRQKDCNRTWRLDRSLTLVGQASRCKVRFNDPSVSNFHCSLLLTASGLWVNDLLSRSGTLVNGKPVRCALLVDGDELQVGKFRIRVYIEGSAPASSLVADLSGEGAFVVTESALNLPVVREASPAARPDADPRSPLPLPVQPLAADELRAPNERLHSLPSPPLTDQADPWKAVIGSLFEQFSSMQQNMFDQFQKTLVMVVQMLNAQQQTQMELVRDELEQIRTLNQELASLQKELISYQTVTPGQAGSLKPGASQPEANQDASLAPKVETRPDLSGDQLVLSRNGVSAPSKAAGEPHNLQDLSEVVPVSLAVTSSPSSTSELNSAGVPSRGADESVPLPSATSQASPSASPEDLHRMIIDRLRTIQEERQSLWQKILKKIIG